MTLTSPPQPMDWKKRLIPHAPMKKTMPVPRPKMTESTAEPNSPKLKERYRAPAFFGVCPGARGDFAKRVKKRAEARNPSKLDRINAKPGLHGRVRSAQFCLQR